MAKRTTKQVLQGRWRTQYGLLLANRRTVLDRAGELFAHEDYKTIKVLLDKLIDLHNAQYRAAGLNIPTEEERRQRLYD